jgi:hypothetical protein
LNSTTDLTGGNTGMAKFSPKIRVSGRACGLGGDIGTTQRVAGPRRVGSG